VPPNRMGTMKFGHFKDSGCGPRRNFGPTGFCSLNIYGVPLREIFGPTGHGNLAQGLPWETHIIASALTRRYLVAPCWKNTRSAGLEVLKGQQNPAASRSPIFCRPYSYRAVADKKTNPG
jgi:hypothetical protein